jgi:hypothetical protein
MRRFLLFGGSNYYPSGGWDDFMESFDSVEDAAKVAKSRGRSHSNALEWIDWAHVVDSTTFQKVVELQID